MDIYLVPGLGADHRLFQRLDLAPHPVHPLNWPAMPEGSSLADFARVLADQVDRTRPHALAGVSMGGMVVQEMAALTRPVRTVVISSWKGPQEMPPPIRVLRGTHAERILTPAFMKRTLPLIRWQMGVETEADKALFDAFIAATPLEQVRVQIAAVLAWEGPSRPVEGLVHIHGSGDRLMPIWHIQRPLRVEGGGHFMVHNRAEDVSQLVLQALEAQATPSGNGTSL
ncbi:MAG: alpha/beta hydrolase [Flavobacteriales bacterium]|jgi:pimeloyl-ACP methyl ester carboxylesterase|nr:MAG: alpha/beta hydrolase [Flavobacteriales bacterium]